MNSLSKKCSNAGQQSRIKQKKLKFYKNLIIKSFIYSLEYYQMNLKYIV